MAIEIGFDVSPLATPGDGIGRYTRELFRALSAGPDAQRVVPLAYRDVPLPRGHELGGPRSRSRAAWTLGLLPRWLGRSSLDVFHATSHYAPLLGPTPLVVTVHDMSTFACPEHHPRARVMRTRALLPLVVRRAAAVIVPSTATKTELVRRLAVPGSRIHVIPEAPSDAFRRAPSAREIVTALDRHGLEPGFFLALGTIEPRKNLVRLATALALLDRGARLVVAGRQGWGYEPVLESVRRLGLGDRVRFLGHVPDAELRALMAAATSLVYPSLYEGFGLPVVEAMAAGLPVVTSRGGALEEVAAGAALLVDPLDPRSIAEGMRRTEGGTERDRLVALGLARADRLDWERTARATLAVYEAAVAGREAAA